MVSVKWKSSTFAQNSIGFDFKNDLGKEQEEKATRNFSMSCNFDIILKLSEMRAFLLVLSDELLGK
jgi:hypothetical protein